MSVTKKDVKSLELVGKSTDESEIYHLETKGGLHKMLKKKRKGDFFVLGQGNHRAVARVLANQMEKNIQWHESLFKSEDSEYLKQIEKRGVMVPDSNSENHSAQAVWHASQHNRSDTLNKIYHGLQAVAHFQAAGLDNKKALEQVNSTLKKLNKNCVMDRPFDENLLKIAWEKKNGKSFPTGE